MLRTIRSLVGRAGEHVLYECRHCGVSVEGPDETCPACGSADVARFLL